MGASRGFRNRADESDWSNIDVLRELRLRGAIRDVYSCMHSWARKSLVLCFAFGHLGVLLFQCRLWDLAPRLFNRRAPLFPFLFFAVVVD